MTPLSIRAITMGNAPMRADRVSIAFSVDFMAFSPLAKGGYHRMRTIDASAFATAAVVKDDG
jgi:hypothetical protein